MAAPSPAAACSRRSWKGLCRSAFSCSMSPSGALRMVSSGPGTDFAPKWSPDGRTLAFLSDRDEPGVSQLCLLDVASQRETRVTLEELWVEYAHWSPDGKSILIGGAERGVDLSGISRRIHLPDVRTPRLPDWSPQVDIGVDDSQWRSLWIYDVASGALRRITSHGLNPWEACWAGNNSIACIASDNPHENDWYKATVRLIDLASGTVRVVYTPQGSGRLPVRLAQRQSACPGRLLQQRPRINDRRSDDRLGEGWHGTARGHRQFGHHLHRLAKRKRYPGRGPARRRNGVGVVRCRRPRARGSCGRERIRPWAAIAIFRSSVRALRPATCAVSMEGFFTPQTVAMFRGGE